MVEVNKPPVEAQCMSPARRSGSRLETRGYDVGIQNMNNAARAFQISVEGSTVIIGSISLGFWLGPTSLLIRTSRSLDGETSALLTACVA